MNRHGARIEAQSDFGADWVAVSLGRGQNENCARRPHIVLEAVAEIIHLLDGRVNLIRCKFRRRKNFDILRPRDEPHGRAVVQRIG